jgi:hypothetical protein
VWGPEIRRDWLEVTAVDDQACKDSAKARGAEMLRGLLFQRLVA